MTAYFSNLLTSTTSRYNNLRRSLLSDEVDGDTEADSHISRVLRAYYVEKGRPFPPWLPPDPHAGPSSTTPQYGLPGSRPPARTASSRRGGGGGLSDLFDSPSQPSQPAQPMSLRRGGTGASLRAPGQPPAAAAAAPQAAYGGSSGSGPYSTGDSYSSRPQRAQPAGARPMPGQRDASSANQASDYSGSTASSTPSLRSATGSGSGGSAQDRLKARLWGAGRSANSTDPYGRGSTG